MIQERSKSHQIHDDLLSNLIAANKNNDEGRQLTEDEVVGDIFMFLIGKSSPKSSTVPPLISFFVAGHETAAHTLAFAFGLLALYPEVQEKLHQHIVEQVADPSGAPVSDHQVIMPCIFTTV